MTTRIDAHVHLWNRAVDPQHWIDPETMGAIDRDFEQPELQQMLAATGCSRAVVVQGTNSLNESIRLSQLDHSVVVGVVAWVDLTADVSAQLERLRSAASVPIVGVRHLAHIDPDPQWLLREDVGRGLSALQSQGLRFDFVVRDWQLPQASAVAAQHEGLQFVLDHLGGPPAPGCELSDWRSDLLALSRLPNVAAKLSGLVSGLAPGTWQSDDLRPVVDVALDAFGADRLLYGSDWPLVELGGGAGVWKASAERLLGALSGLEREHIFGLNAAEIYSLD